MSVINRMLQDLEARRAGSGQAPTAVRATAPGLLRKRLLLWCVLGAAAVAAVGFGDWPRWGSAQAARAPQVAAIAPGAVASAVEPPAPPAALPEPTPTLPAAAATKSAAPAPKRASPALSAAAAPTPPPPLTMAAVSYGLEPALGTASSRTLKAAPPSAAPRAEADNGAAMPSPEPTGRVDKRMSPQSPAQLAQALTQQGQQASASGHGRTALEHFEQALALQPQLLAARVPAIVLLLEQGRHAEAQTMARAGLSLAPGDAQLSYLLARDLAAAGERAAALAVLDVSTRLDADALGLRAGVLTQQGEFKRAGEDYEAALRAQPTNSLWWLGLGVALESQGQPQQARRVYVRAQTLGLDSHELSLFVDQKLAALK